MGGLCTRSAHRRPSVDRPRPGLVLPPAGNRAIGPKWSLDSTGSVRVPPSRPCRRDGDEIVAPETGSDVAEGRADAPIPPPWSEETLWMRMN